MNETMRVVTDEIIPQDDCQRGFIGFRSGARKFYLSALKIVSVEDTDEAGTSLVVAGDTEYIVSADADTMMGVLGEAIDRVYPSRKGGPRGDRPRPDFRQHRSRA